MAVLRHGECPKKENARRDSKGQRELWASQGDTVQEKDASELGCPLLHLEKASTKQKTGRAGGKADRKPVYGDRGKVSETTSVTESAQAGQRVRPEARAEESPPWSGPCRTAQPEHQPGGDRAPTGAVRD